MATRVTLTPLSSEPDSPVEVAKTPLSNDRADRAAEADWLRRAARPGVVPLVATPPGSGGPEDHDPAASIITRHVGSRTLRTARLDPAEACQALVEVAELLVELHRDGLVHGKLTPDHVILGAERVWLCSPDGTVDDPTSDIEGLARCMHDVRRQWEEAGRRPPDAAEWTAVAERFADNTDPSRSAPRALAALRSLATIESAETGPPASRRLRSFLSLPSRRGVVALTVFTVGAIGGLFVVAAEPTPGDSGGPRFEVDGAVYTVGSSGDDVAVLEQPCEPAYPVYVLEESSGTVWAFDRIADGAQPVPVVVVPGATDIRAHWRNDTEPCSVALASGPAGATVIDPGSVSTVAGVTG